MGSDLLFLNDRAANPGQKAIHMPCSPAGCIGCWRPGPNSPQRMSNEMGILHFPGPLLKGIVRRSLLNAVSTCYLPGNLWWIAEPLMATWNSLSGEFMQQVTGEPLCTPTPAQGPEDKVWEQVKQLNPLPTAIQQPVPQRCCSAVFQTKMS